MTKNSDSHSAGSTEVFCDLDQHAGRRRSSGTTHSLPSPRPMKDRPRRHSWRRLGATAGAVAGSFRKPDTGESPSRIDSSSLTAVPGLFFVLHIHVNSFTVTVTVEFILYPVSCTVGPDGALQNQTMVLSAL